MKTRIRNNLFIILLLLFNLKCTNSNINKKTYIENNLIIIKDFYKSGSLNHISKLTLDYKPTHDWYDFYKNGSLKKWVWYQSNKKYPICGFYYDSLNNYKYSKGDPFIWAPKTPTGATAVEIVKPPLVKFQVVYSDYLKNDLIRQITYEPSETDSTQWVTLDAYKYDSTHVYILQLLIYNKSNKLVDVFADYLVP